MGDNGQNGMKTPSSLPQKVFNYFQISDQYITKLFLKIPWDDHTFGLVVINKLCSEAMSGISEVTQVLKSLDISPASS